MLDADVGVEELPLERRVSRGKNGVTSSGILSRAEVIATGAVLTKSALLSQALTFTRPPRGRAEIWSSLLSSSAGAEFISETRRCTVPSLLTKELPR